MPTPSSPNANSARGVSLVVAGALCFGAMSMVVKQIGDGVSLFQLAFFRSALGLLVLSVVVWSRRGPLRGRSTRPLLLARGVFGALAMLAYFFAIHRIPLADAVVLNYTSPAFTTVLAVLFLRERPSRRTLAATALALVGVALVMRPTWSGGRAGAIGYLAGVAAAVFSGAAYVTVKRLTALSNAWTIVWYFGAVTSVVTLPLAMLTWRSPSASIWVSLVAMSLLGTGGQLLMTAGFRHGAVSKTSIATVAVVVVAAVGGWVVWGERPTGLSAVGALIVVVAVLAASRREPA